MCRTKTISRSSRTACFWLRVQSWQDWFTRGSSHFLRRIPGMAAESRERSYARPAFQFLIYLAHFAFGTNWGWYQCINCFAVAGIGCSSFLHCEYAIETSCPTIIARLHAGCAFAPSCDSIEGCGVWSYAIEPLAYSFRGGRLSCSGWHAATFFCGMLLFLALLTKENSRVGAGRSGHNNYVAPCA